jgi:hypothetical protein
MRKKFPLCACAIISSFVATGCNDGQSSAAVPAQATAAQQNATGAAPTDPVKISRVVFVDQEDSCPCARKRADVAWKALHDAMTDAGVRLPVEQMHADSEAGKAAPYQALRPILVIPGLYFLDQRGQLVDFLQGELKAAQVLAVLKK